MKAKKVEMRELFYDLVFAYAIANMTDLLENFQNGGSAWKTVLIYLLCFIVLTNSWMYQTVFNNRYGKNSIADILLNDVGMILLLLVSSSLSDDLHTIFYPFTRALGALSALLFCQYALAYKKADDPIDRRLIKDFLWMTGIRTAFILIGTLFPLPIGFYISMIGVIVGWILPTFFTKDMKKRPVSFSHLNERLSLLTILMFGEMIVGLSSFFHVRNFGLYSILLFGICATLFSCYVLYYQHPKIDKNSAFTGVGLVYLHYPILLGLNLFTASMHFMVEEQIQFSLAVILWNLGLLLFLLGTFGCMDYLKEFTNRDPKKWGTALLIIPLAALEIYFQEPLLVVSLSFILVLAITLRLYFYFKTA